MKRRRHLVGYDIRDPKRLHKVYKTLQGFGIRMQYSVFICDLTASERLALLQKLGEIIDPRVDCVAAVDLGEAGDERAFLFLGAQPTMPVSGSMVL